MNELADVFVSARGEPADAAARALLGPALESALVAARQAWPGVVADAAAWMRAIAPLAPTPLDATHVFGALAVSDHYLAFACANGDPTAVATCDAIVVREAGLAATGTRAHDSVRDEAIQIVRATLLAPREDRPPAIRDYVGRGALRAWIRVVVSREIVRLAKHQNRTTQLEDHLVAASASDPLLDQLKAKYRDELANAFRAALAELPAREHTLLRYQVIDNLTIDEIGAIYRVHRATAARWIAKIRETLVETTRARMAAALGVDTEEAASIVRLVQSQLEVSVIRHLKS